MKSNLPIRKTFEHMEKKKTTDTWEYYKWVPSSRDERKRKKRVTHKKKKFLETKRYCWNVINGINTCLLSEVLWALLKLDTRETQKYGQ